MAGERQEARQTEVVELSLREQMFVLSVVGVSIENKSWRLGREKGKIAEIIFFLFSLGIFVVKGTSEQCRRAKKRHIGFPAKLFIPIYKIWPSSCSTKRGHI